MFRGLYAFLRLQEDDQNTVRLRGPDGWVVWGAGLSSCDLQVAGSIPVATQSCDPPTNGASVAVIRYMRMTVTGRNLNTRGYGRKLATTLTRPKTSIITIIITALLNSKRSKTT